MRGILWKTLTHSMMACLLVAVFTGGAISATECQSCHREEPFLQTFFGSVHGANGCTSCHQGIESLDRHMGETKNPGCLPVRPATVMWLPGTQKATTPFIRT